MINSCMHINVSLLKKKKKKKKTFISVSFTLHFLITIYLFYNDIYACDQSIIDLQETIIIVNNYTVYNTIHYIKHKTHY